jgi:hypothetical protein
MFAMGGRCPGEWACLMYRIDRRIRSIAVSYRYVYRKEYFGTVRELECKLFWYECSEPGARELRLANPIQINC